MAETIQKVWGLEELCVNNEKYCAKLLHLHRDYQCSVHFHKEKDETFYIMEGKVLMEVGTEEPYVMHPGDSVRIRPGVSHRFTGVTCAIILEVSTTDKKEDSYRSTQSQKVKR